MKQQYSESLFFFAHQNDKGTCRATQGVNFAPTRLKSLTSVTQLDDSHFCALSHELMHAMEEHPLPSADTPKPCQAHLPVQERLHAC